MKPSVLLAAFLLLSAGVSRADDPVFRLKTAAPDFAAKVEKYRTELQAGGYRFDEDAGTLISPSTHQPASTPEIQRYVDQIVLYRAHAAVERIQDLLKGLDPDKPVPPEIAARIDQIVKDTPGFPADVAKVLEGAHVAKAGELRTEALKSYLALTRLVESDIFSFNARVNGAKPVETGWRNNPQVVAYQTAEERAVGERLSRAAVDYFGRYATGRELLDHFRDDKGQLKLPDMLVLKIMSGAEAVYSASDRALICNLGPMARSIVERAPADKQDALAKQLATVKGLNEYLVKDPGALSAFLQANDVAVYHELTHAWQDRRQRLPSEQLRGNAPGYDPIECEWEAFTNQNRFLHEKLLKDPDAAMRSVYFPAYRSMLADYGQFTDGIARQYLQLIPGGSATLPEMSTLQGDRVGATKTMMGGSISAYVHGLMKLAGMAFGSTAMAEAQSDYQARRDAFQKDELPRMRVEGNLAIANKLDAAGDLSGALAAAFDADRQSAAAANLEKDARALADRLSVRALDSVKKGEGDPVQRGSLVDALATRNIKLHRGPEITPDVHAGAYLGAAAEYLRRAELATDPAVKLNLSQTAKAWVDALGALKPGDFKDPKIWERLKALRFQVGEGPQ